MDYEKLAKILALAGSDNSGEATSALRMATQMLARAGLDFVDLAQGIEQRSIRDATHDALATDLATLKSELYDLRLLTSTLIEEINAMRLHAAKQSAQLDKARKNVDFLRDRLRRSDTARRDFQRRVSRDEVERQMLLRQLRTHDDATRELESLASTPDKSDDPGS
ncbi:MAG: DUF2786 domain-containing protein [Azospirillaceae bacterium]|nr:DUF2786 domain-containing protein [Azospirillaceae bacterium]